MEQPLSRLSAWLPWAVALVALGGVVATYPRYGPNWDEAVQARYGELVIDYFVSGFRDTRANDFLNLRYYNSLVEVIPALFYERTAGPKYEVRHLFVALIGIATLPALIRYCGIAAIPWLPGLAVLALVTMPRFYGDWFTNSKDIPFACMMTWSLYAVVALFLHRRFAWSDVAHCGVIFGLTLGVRPGGFPLLAIYFAGVGVLAYLAAPPEPRPALNQRGPSRLVTRTLAIFAIAWIIMVLPWPWAHENPVAHPIEAIRAASSFTTSYPVLFEGRFVPSSVLPWYYLAKFLLITTPPAVLLLALLGLVTGLLAVRRPSTRSSFVLLATLLWLAVPLTLFAVFRPNVYDGVRHFLFILPALAVLAAFGASWLSSQLPGGRRRAAALVVGVALLLLPVADLIALHPYQTTYFNVLVGGVAGADGKYDTDYWLTSYREAIEWVNEQARRAPGKQIVVEIAGDGYITPWVGHYAAPAVSPRVVARRPTPLTLPEGIDYYIATTRWELHRGYPRAPVVHVIGRRGAVFTVIKGRDPEGSRGSITP